RPIVSRRAGRERENEPRRAICLAFPPSPARGYDAGMSEQRVSPGDRLRCCKDSSPFRGDIFTVTEFDPGADTFTATAFQFGRPLSVELKVDLIGSYLVKIP